MIDEKLVEALERILEYERREEERRSKDPHLKGSQVWWEWQDVGVHYTVIHKLLLAGFLESIGGRRKYYKLKDRGKAYQVVQSYKARVENLSKQPEEKIPGDLFEPIVGHDDVKRVVLMSLRSGKPVHILLKGPPASGKTLFLMELARLPGARFITASGATRVGIRDLLFEEAPRYLLIDELEKVNSPDDLASLLSWMESGVVTITKHGVREKREGVGWVFAACNKTSRLTGELLDRFRIIEFRPYTKQEFRRVATEYLTKREGLDGELVAYAVERVLGRHAQPSVRLVRDIVRLARTREDVDFLTTVFTS